MNIMRDIHHGEITAEARAAWAQLEADRDSFPEMPSTSRMTVCTSQRLYGMEPCVPCMDALPAHQTCGTITCVESGNRIGGMCWCWTGCDNPDCTHPACAMRGWATFRDAWPDDRLARVLLWTSEWESWDTAGRHQELLDEWRQGAHRSPKAAKLVDRMLTALQRGPINPLRLGGEHYLDAELAIAGSGVQLECRWTCTTTEDHLAYGIARGHTLEEDTGGTVEQEVRLAEALDLEVAPAGYQGSLFG